MAGEATMTTLATIANQLIQATEKHASTEASSSIFGTDVDVGDEINRFSRSQLTFAAVMTIIIMIVGIFGNLLTTVALMKCPKVRNVAAAFIISLCVADCIFCIAVLPFNAFRFIEGTWTHGDFLCKLVPFIQYGNIGVSLLCIAMITINRYVMIAHHTSYAKIYKRHWIGAMIVFCWVFSYGMQLPTLLSVWGRFGYDEKLGTCSILQDRFGRSSKTALFAIAFVIPCIIIIACYAKIFWVVHQSEIRMRKHAHKQNSIPNNMRPVSTATTTANEPGTSTAPPGTTSSSAIRPSQASSSSFENTSGGAGGENKQKALRIKDHRDARAKRNEWRITKMVLAIFLSFVACYLPITIVKVLDRDVHWPAFHILGYIMLYLSACINPIIYVIMNKQYRQAYKTVLTCKPTRLLPFGSSNGEMERHRVQVRQQQSYNGITGFPCRTKQQFKQYQQHQPITSACIIEPTKTKRYGQLTYEYKIPTTLQQQQSYPPPEQYILEQYYKYNDDILPNGIITIPTSQQQKYFTLQSNSRTSKRPKWTTELQQYQAKQSFKLADEYENNNTVTVSNSKQQSNKQYQPYFTTISRYNNESPPSERFREQQQYQPYQQRYAIEQPYRYTDLQCNPNEKCTTTDNRTTGNSTKISYDNHSRNTFIPISPRQSLARAAAVAAATPKTTSNGNSIYRYKPPITTATIFPTPRYSASRYTNNTGRGGYNNRRGRISCNFPNAIVGRTYFYDSITNQTNENQKRDESRTTTAFETRFKRHSR